MTTREKIEKHSMSAGLCRGCSADGPIGDPCTSKPCREDGLHYLPKAEAEAFRKLDVAKREPLVGSRIDRFLVVRRLGRGGFGRVLLALQAPFYNKQVAVKILSFDTDDERIRAVVSDKFVQEAQTLSGLKHTNIVTFIDFRGDGEPPYLAMEYIEGGQTLNHVMDARDGEPVPSRVIKGLVDQVLSALTTMHKASLIHRDLKPDNIMIARDGRRDIVKLVDFGLAKDVSADVRTKYLAGTVAYMAPEQLEPGATLGPATDLYALAVITFELITGRKLFTGPHMAVKTAKGDPDFDAFALHPDLELSPETKAFFRIALATRPEQRYATTESFGAAFDELFTYAADVRDDEGFAPTLLKLGGKNAPSIIDQPTGHDRTSTVRPTTKKTGSRRGLVIPGALAALAVAGVGIGIAMSSSNTPSVEAKTESPVTTAPAAATSIVPTPTPEPAPAPMPEPVPAPASDGALVPEPEPTPLRYRLETSPVGATVKVGDAPTTKTPADIEALPGTEVQLSRTGCQLLTITLPATPEALAPLKLKCEHKPIQRKRDLTGPDYKRDDIPDFLP